MKFKKILVVFTLIMLVFINTSFADSNELNLIAKSVILVETNSNKMLYKKNEKEKMYPASTTKILTAILAIENCNLDDVVTASYNAIVDILPGYSNASIKIGEELTVKQLLDVLMVISANDAANVLAEHVGGSIDSFASMMNTKLDELKCYNSHFTNAYGKHDDNHYTTAYDLAVIFKYCIKNETFRKIAGQTSCMIPATNSSEVRKYNSTNSLLIKDSDYYYQYAFAGKTGYTTQAGNCLVSASYKDNMELVCVVLSSSNTEDGFSGRFSDSIKLFDYGFKNFSYQNVINKSDVITQVEISNATKDTKNLDIIVSAAVNVLLPNSVNPDDFSPEISLNENLLAPISEGDNVGTAKYVIYNKEYELDLIASSDVQEVEVSNLMYYGIAAFVITSILIIIIVFTVKSKRKFR